MKAGVLAVFLKYLERHGPELLRALGQHLLLVVYGSFFALLLGFALGVFLARREKARAVLLGAAGVVSTIPILALFGILITMMGIGTAPVVVALVAYSLLPICRNTTVGLAQVGRVEREAALGMGANRGQLFFRVELPLAFPVILAGVRTTVVMNFSIATYAIFIGGGGMGTIIMRGLRTFNDVELVVGTLVVAFVTVGLDRSLGSLERLVDRRGRSGPAAAPGRG